MRFFTRHAQALTAALLLTTAGSGAAQEQSLDVRVEDVSVSDATFIIIPSDESVKYVWDYCTLEDFDDIRGGEECIYDYYIDVWTRMAKDYDEPDWQSMMAYYMVEGEINTTAQEESDPLMWDTDYVLYAFSMDSEGNLSIPLTYKLFRTFPAKVSDNTFKVTVDSMVRDCDPDAKKQTVETTITVTPSNDDPYFVRVMEKRFTSSYDLTPGSEGEREFIINSIIPYIQDTYTGQQTITFPKQKADTEYCIAIIGYEEAPTTGLTLVEYTAEEKAPVEYDPFMLEVTDITQCSAHIKIVPPTQDMKYYWYITTPEIIEMHGGRDIVDEELDFGWYKYLSDLYGGDPTWQELMLQFLNTGTIDLDSKDMPDDCPELRWDTDYVLYAYGLNDKCERITPIYFSDFRMAECNEVDLSFEMSLVSVEDDPDYSYGNVTRHKVMVDIYPSEDGIPFAVNYHRTIILDQYYDRDDDLTIDDYIFDQFRPECAVFDAPVRLEMRDINEKDDYYVVVMGWDGAPTTDLDTFQFNYMSKPSKLETVGSGNFRVIPVEGAVAVEGEYESAVVYNVDGKVMGAIRGAGSRISLPAGLYIVKCVAKGKTVATKCVVR